MLEQESTKQVSYISRYNGFKTFYNRDDKKYCNGRTAWTRESAKCIYYITQKGDTWDNLSLKFYGNPTYYWLMLDGNRITNAFQKVPEGVEIIIPILSDIEFIDGDRT